MSSIDRALLTALIALAVACKAPDAVDPDAMMIDASAPDATPTAPVRITVLDSAGNGSIFVGSALVFNDAQGHLLSSMVVTTTDEIDVQLPEGASVTAVLPTQVGERDLETVFGVEPGDELVLSMGGGNHSSVRVLSMTYPDIPGATYEFGVPCAINAISDHGIVLDHDCTGGPAFVAAHLPDGSDEFLEVDSLPPPPATNVDFTGPWRSLEPFSATWANIPADVTFVLGHRDADHRLGWIDGWPPAVQSGSTVTESGMAASTNASEVISTLVSRGGYQQLIMERTPGNQLTYQLDVGAALMPWLTASFDQTSGLIQISGSGGVTPDVLATSLDYTFGRTVVWTLFSPMTSSIQLPELPDSLADLRPTPNDTVSAGVGAFEWSDVDDYAAYRRHFDDTFGGPAFRFSGSVMRETL